MAGLLVALLCATALSGCDRLAEWWRPGSSANNAPADPSTTAAPLARLKCSDHGQETLSITIRDLPRRTKPEQAVVKDPNENGNVTYEGVRAEGLFDTVYGSVWRKARGVRIFTAAKAGVVIPVQRFMSQRAWFAWKRADRPDFVIDRGRGTAAPLELGPLYLIWDTSEPLAAEAGNVGWVPQVTALDLTDEAADEEAIQPAAGVSPGVSSGFQAYRKYCLRCHTINGRGGLSGPELNIPVSVTEYLSDAWITRFIDAPDKIRARTAMPGLPLDTPERDKTIAHIIEYLHYMAAHKAVAVPAPGGATPTGTQDTRAPSPVSP